MNSPTQRAGSEWTSGVVWTVGWVRCLAMWYSRHRCQCSIRCLQRHSIATAAFVVARLRQISVRVPPPPNLICLIELHGFSRWLPFRHRTPRKITGRNARNKVRGRQSNRPGRKKPASIAAPSRPVLRTAANLRLRRRRGAVRRSEARLEVQVRLPWLAQPASCPR